MSINLPVFLSLSYLPPNATFFNLLYLEYFHLKSITQSLKLLSTIKYSFDSHSDIINTLTTLFTQYQPNYTTSFSLKSLNFSPRHLFPYTTPPFPLSSHICIHLHVTTIPSQPIQKRTHTHTCSLLAINTPASPSRAREAALFTCSTRHAPSSVSITRSPPCTVQREIWQRNLAWLGKK